MPDTAALGRKPSLPGQWVDLPPPLAGTLKEPFEIKVYEIDDVERLQRRRVPPREGPAEVGTVGVWLGGQGGFSVLLAARQPHLPLSSAALPELGKGRNSPAGHEPLAVEGVLWPPPLCPGIALGWGGAFPQPRRSSWAWVPGGLGGPWSEPHGGGERGGKGGAGSNHCPPRQPHCVPVQAWGVEPGSGQGWGAGTLGSRPSSMPEPLHAPPPCSGPGVRQCQAAAGRAQAAAAAGGAGEAGAVARGAG